MIMVFSEKNIVFFSISSPWKQIFQIVSTHILSWVKISHYAKAQRNSPIDFATLNEEVY